MEISAATGAEIVRALRASVSVRNTVTFNSHYLTDVLGALAGQVMIGLNGPNAAGIVRSSDNQVTASHTMVIAWVPVPHA